MAALPDLGPAEQPLDQTDGSPGDGPTPSGSGTTTPVQRVSPQPQQEGTTVAAMVSQIESGNGSGGSPITATLNASGISTASDESTASLLEEINEHLREGDIIGERGRALGPGDLETRIREARIAMEAREAAILASDVDMGGDDEDDDDDDFIEVPERPESPAWPLSATQSKKIPKIKFISLYPHVKHLFHILNSVELGSITTSSRTEQTVDKQVTSSTTTSKNSLKPYDDFSANVVVNRLLFKFLSHYPTQTASSLTSAPKNPMTLGTMTSKNSLKSYDDFIVNLAGNRLHLTALSLSSAPKNLSKFQNCWSNSSEPRNKLIEGQGLSTAKNALGTTTSKNSLKPYDDFILLENPLHLTASSLSSAPIFFSKFQNFFWKICQKFKKSNFRICPQIQDTTPRSRVIDKTRIHREKLSKNGILELRSHNSLYLMVFEQKFFLTNYNEADFILVSHSVRKRPTSPPPTYKVKEEKVGCSGSSSNNNNNNNNNNNKTFDLDQNTPASSMNSATNTASSLSSAKNNHTASRLSSATKIPHILIL
jgi:hypothetical protein